MDDLDRAESHLIAAVDDYAGDNRAAVVLTCIAEAYIKLWQAKQQRAYTQAVESARATQALIPPSPYQGF